MTDADVLIAAWILVSIIGMVFVTVLYGALQVILYALARIRENRRRRMHLLGDPFGERGDKWHS